MLSKSQVEEQLRDSIEKLTQGMLKQGAGQMLASGMSESAVVKLCYKTSKLYHEGMIDRYKDVLDIPEE